MLTLHFFFLLLSQLNFLDLRSFLGANSLVLNCGALVIQLGHYVSQVKLNLVLLEDVVEGELDDDLAESCVLLCLLDSSWSPNDVDDLCRLSLLVGLFSDVSEGEWDSQTLFSSAMLLLLILGHGFLLKWVNDVVLAHIEEHLFASIHIFGLDHEAFAWLNDCASLLVDVRFAARSLFFRCLSRRHLIEQLLHLGRAVSTLDVFVDLHQLRVSVRGRWPRLFPISSSLLTSIGVEASLLSPSSHIIHCRSSLRNFAK